MLHSWLLGTVFTGKRISKLVKFIYCHTYPKSSAVPYISEPLAVNVKLLLIFFVEDRVELDLRCFIKKELRGIHMVFSSIYSLFFRRIVVLCTAFFFLVRCLSAGLTFSSKDSGCLAPSSLFEHYFGDDSEYVRIILERLSREIWNLHFNGADTDEIRRQIKLKDWMKKTRGY